MLEKAKLQGQKSDQWLPGTGDRMRDLLERNMKQFFGDDGNILYLECGGSYMPVYTCQNTQIYTPKKGESLQAYSSLSLNLKIVIKKKQINDLY